MEFNILASISIAVISFSTPIMIQVISRLDDKYNSDDILRIFLSEWKLKFYVASLCFAAVALLLYTMKLKPLITFENSDIQWIIGNSSSSILVISVILLLFSFARIIHLIFIYYVPYLFIPYLVKRKEGKKMDNKIRALSDIFLLFEREEGKHNYLIAIASYLHQRFSEIRKQSESEDGYEYPAAFKNLAARVGYRLATNSLNFQSHPYGNVNLAS